MNDIFNIMDVLKLKNVTVSAFTTKDTKAGDVEAELKLLKKNGLHRGYKVEYFKNMQNKEVGIFTVNVRQL